MHNRTSPPNTRPAAAAASDQIDALVGMLLEQAKIMHLLLGSEERTFDYDETRRLLYATAAAPVGRNARADRYRTHARRGIGASHAQTAPHVDNSALPPCESSP